MKTPKSDAVANRIVQTAWNNYEMEKMGIQINVEMGKLSPDEGKEALGMARHHRNKEIMAALDIRYLKGLRRLGF